VAVRDNRATLLAEASWGAACPGTWSGTRAKYLECGVLAHGVTWVRLVPDGVFVLGEGGVLFELLPPPTQGGRMGRLHSRI